MSKSARRASSESSAWVWVPVAAIAMLVAAVILVIASGDGNQPSAAPGKPVPGTPSEIGTEGNDGNPRALFHGAYPSIADTQELVVGGSPARFSGYTTWVRSAKRVPARRLVEGYGGDYLRLRVTIFNRDTQEQHVCACDFFVWTREHGRREADVVRAPTVSPDTYMQSGNRLDGDVYLYVGTVRGPYFVVYDPDAQGLTSADRAKGVWRVRA